MKTTRAIGRLTGLIASRQRMIEGVRRNKRWRDSEKAMSIAGYVEDQSALRLAIAAIELTAISPRVVKGLTTY